MESEIDLSTLIFLVAGNYEDFSQDGSNAWATFSYHSFERRERKPVMLSIGERSICVYVYNV